MNKCKHEFDHNWDGLCKCGISVYEYVAQLEARCEIYEEEKSQVVFDILKIIDKHMCLGDCNSNWLFMKSDLRKYFGTDGEL